MGELTTPFDGEGEPIHILDTDATDLTMRAAKGVSWAGLFQVLAQPVTLLTTIFLARLLAPADFGLMSMAGIVVGLIALVNELGLASAVVQKEDLNQRELSSLFWFNLAVGIGFTLLGVVLSWPVAEYFGRPILVPMLITLSLGYTLGSITTIHGAILMRRMEFRALASYGFISTVTTSAVALALGAAGAGVWSLVMSSLIGPLAPVLLMWRRVHWRPSRQFDWASCRRLVHFGANVTMSGILGYGASNIDYAVIGRQLGASALGVYTFAFNLMLFPLRKFSTLLITATYPAFSRIQAEPERFRRAYLRSSGLLALVSAPLLLTVLVAAPEIIVGLYGSKWVGAIVPLQVLVAAGIQKSVGTLVGVVFRGMGQPGIEARWSLVNFLVLATAVLVAVRWGTVGVAAAVSIAAWATGIPIQMSALRLMDARLRDFVAAVLPGAGMGVAAAGGAFLVRLMTGEWPPLIAAVAMVVAGVGVAGLVGWLVWRPVVMDLVGVLSGILRSRAESRRKRSEEQARTSDDE